MGHALCTVVKQWGPAKSHRSSPHANPFLWVVRLLSDSNHVKWLNFSCHVSDEAVLRQKPFFVQRFCAILNWHVLTWFQMWHLWPCAELVKPPGVCCFHTARACQKIAEAPPLQIPSHESFEKSNGLAVACYWHTVSSASSTLFF